MITQYSFFRGAMVLTGSLFALYPSLATFSLFAGASTGFYAWHRHQNRPVLAKTRTSAVVKVRRP